MIGWKEWKQQRESFSAYDPENDDPAENPDYQKRPPLGKPKRRGTSYNDAAAIWLKQNDPALKAKTKLPRTDSTSPKTKSLGLQRKLGSI